MQGKIVIDLEPDNKANHSVINFGKGWEFTAISCVVIGGTAFTGGKGRVWGTFVGLFFYGIITNAMTLLNINQYMQYIVRGALILIAVIINSYNPKHK